MLGIPLSRDPMHDSTYKLLEVVRIPLHNVLVVDNCDTPLVLYLVQNLLSLILHLYILLDLLSVNYTEAPDCTARYCTEVVLCCIVVAQYYMVVVQYYTATVSFCMELEHD